MHCITLLLRTWIIWFRSFLRRRGDLNAYELTIRPIARIVIFFFFLAGASSLAFAASISEKPAMRASVGTSLPLQGVSSGTQKNIPSVLALAQSTPTSLERSKVFFLREAESVGPGFKINASVVDGMVKKLVCAVTEKSTVSEAWRSLVKVGEHGDRVGIKVATEPGLLAGTHVQIVQAIIKELVEAGVKREKIIVWDRRQQDLESAGYTKISGLSLQWIEHGSGYDPMVIYTSPIIGRLMYGDFEFKEFHNTLLEQLGPKAQLSNKSHYALILSREVDKVINIPSLCDSTYSGVNGALANMTLGEIDNWRRFTKAPYFGDTTIGELYHTDPINHKVIMTIMDGLALQYAGGPSANPSHVIPYTTIFASRDPVALDATAIRLIDAQRLIAHLPKLDELGGHVQSAESLGLGHAAEGQIEMININTQKHHFFEN